MRRPSLKLIGTFIAAILIGYLIVLGILIPLLHVTLREFNWGWTSTVAILIGMLLIIIVDTPLELHAFEWPLELEKKTMKVGLDQAAKSASNRFPYEEQAEHWDVDFSDSHQTYEGTALPIWLLAGWAIFILWAVIYLISGLPGAF